MFDRYIRLAKAKKALRDERFEDALALAADPVIQQDRRAEAIRAQAAAQILARGRRHLEAGDLQAARVELLRLRSGAAGPATDALAAAIEKAAAGDEIAGDLTRRTLHEVRRLIDRGETAAGAALLATLGSAHLLLERKQLEQLLAERRRQAAALCAHGRDSLDRGCVEAAAEALARADAIDRDAAEAVDLRASLVGEAVRRAGPAIAECLARGECVGAIERYRAAMAALPLLARAEVMESTRRRLSAAALETLQAAGSVAEALPVASAVLGAGLSVDAGLVDLADAVVRAAGRLGSGEVALAAEHLARAAEAANALGLRQAASALGSTASLRDRQLTAVREVLAGGRLDEARAALLKILVDEPMHDEARRELELVDQGLADLARRLESARAAARAGRLREACTAALALAGSSRVADEAQQLVRDVRARMAIVDRGLDEVRVALHSRVAAGVEGVRHCLGRLEELAKVQTDHEDLPKVVLAVEAEIQALGVCERAGSALDRHAVDEAVTAVLELIPLCDRLLARERLDARVCALADRARVCAEGALASGRLAEVDRCVQLLEQLRGVRAEFGERAERLRASASDRREAAKALVAQALESLSRRDLAEAERLGEAARIQWAECADVRQLLAQLSELRQQVEVLGRVEVMTNERDFLGARQKLATMPPTQALLRTRIYDMKQNLARAQGLEGAFLLRVDEGGEHLVVRGESVSIGNVRQTRADLPVLASLAGRHASIRRTMSFHGGMQDTIVAEEGDVRVGDCVVTSRPLVPGDRVQLGSALAFVYHRPSARSLSATLTLQGGFQVAGTDRIVLMKDRGRDGRILLGPGRDVHVRVQKATGEVEVFATNTGQIRVFCDVDGTIDGVAFRGEHPLAAGQIVEAGGLSFLLLPWRPTV